MSRPPAQAPGEPASPSPPPLLQVEGLTLTTGNGLVCGPLELAVRPGETALVLVEDLEILRRLMKCCLAFERPDSGRLSWWPGAVPAEAGESDWAGYDFFRQIGYVDRLSQLLAHWTLLDHFRFFQLYSRRTEDPEAGPRLLAKLGLDKIENTLAEDLPEPTRRLALYALALFQRPRLMLLERPLQFLDRDFGLTWDVILDQSRTEGLAVVVFDRARAPYEADAFHHRADFTIGGRPFELPATRDFS